MPRPASIQRGHPRGHQESVDLGFHVDRQKDDARRGKGEQDPDGPALEDGGRETQATSARPTQPSAIAVMAHASGKCSVSTSCGVKEKNIAGEPAGWDDVDQLRQRARAASTYAACCHVRSMM
jgi:hypothetical protein